MKRQKETLRFFEVLSSNSSEKNLSQKIKKLSRIESVSLINSSKVTDLFLEDLSFRSIKSFALANCKNITEKGVGKFLHKQQKSLTELNLADSSLVSDNLTQFFPSSCIEIDLSFFSKEKDLLTDQGVQNLANQCSKLKYLNLYGRRNLTDVSFHNLAEKCSKIETLYFPGNSAKSLTKSAFDAIALKCSNIKSINFGCYDTLDAHTISQFLRKSKQLKTMNLNFCSQVTDSCFTDLDSSVLNFLSLKNCLQITDKALFAISKKCKKLKNLYLSFCENITDEGISSLVSCCRSLKTLDLSRLCKISIQSVIQLLEHCPQLEYLNLAGCKNISLLSLQKLTIPPNLRLISP